MSNLKCHETHPPYPVAEGFVIRGGSGIRPHYTKAEIYISLDDARRPGVKSYPWVKGQDIVFHIPNFGVPSDPPLFEAMIEWIEKQVRAGKEVHVGCMAGHGRTGLVLAALRMKMAGDKDAIAHVRKNYCDQAVENQKQVDWLVKHWGVNPAPPRVRRYDKPTKGKGGTDFLSYGFDSAREGGAETGRWAARSTRTIEDEDGLLGFPKRKARVDTPDMSQQRYPDQTSFVAHNPWEDERVEAPSGPAAWYEEGEPS